MYSPNRLDQARQRRRLTLADLDPWVADPQVYEREREQWTIHIVKYGVALFPGEAELAALPKNAAGPRPTTSDIPASDLYGSYLREVRSIPTMERAVEFRFALALEICKHALRAELTLGDPSLEDLTAIERAIDSKDATFQRLLAQERAARGEEQDAELDEDAEGDALDGRLPRAGAPQKRGKAAQGNAAHGVSVKLEQRIERVRQRFDEMLGWKKVLVFRTLPLVPGMARRYKGMGVPILDLIQEANGSLLKATDRYEWRKGVRFVVYARWWVQQGILKSLSCQSRTVRTPVYMAQKLKKIRDLNERSLTRTGDTMSAEELGKALDEPVERIQRALEAAKMTISIDREIDPSGEFMLKDVLVDPRDYSVPEAPPAVSLQNRIRQLLGELPPRERQVIEWRFGLNEQKVETLDEVSQRLGVSRERVRQIQEQALRRLQSPSKKMNLAAYLPEE
jgi:RNA polymerase primary sigma factor